MRLSTKFLLFGLVVGCLGLMSWVNFAYGILPLSVTATPLANAFRAFAGVTAPFALAFALLLRFMEGANYLSRGVGPVRR